MLFEYSPAIDNADITAELKAVRDELKITKENADSAAKRYQPESSLTTSKK